MSATIALRVATVQDFFNRRMYIRTLLYGYAIGTLIVWVTSFGRKTNLLRTAVDILIIGFCINSMIWALQYLFRRQVMRLPVNRQLPFHIILTTVGGVLGFIVGMTLAFVLLRGRLPNPRIFAEPLLITTGVSFFFGFSMFYYFRLEDRLRDKIRETELAQQELTLARAIQERLLPSPELSGDGFRVTARNLAAQFVAGDFYDLILRSDGALIAVVADVAGKGVAASLTMASVKSILPLIASAGTVEATMRSLNAKLFRELGRREFVALTCASYEPSTRRVTIANAGLPDPYLIRDGSATPVVLGGPRLPLGVRENVEYESVSVELRPGDRLLMLTDGLPEAGVGEDEPLGYERIAQIASATTSIDGLFKAVESEAPGPRNDDWTAVLLEVNP